MIFIIQHLSWDFIVFISYFSINSRELDFNEVLLKLVIGANKKIIFSLIYEERLPRIDNQYESVIYIVPEYVK